MELKRYFASAAFIAIVALIATKLFQLMDVERPVPSKPLAFASNSSSPFRVEDGKPFLQHLRKPWDVSRLLTEDFHVENVLVSNRSAFMYRTKDSQWRQPTVVQPVSKSTLNTSCIFRPISRNCVSKYSYKTLSLDQLPLAMKEFTNLDDYRPLVSEVLFPGTSELTTSLLLQTIGPELHHVGTLTCSLIYTFHHNHIRSTSGLAQEGFIHCRIMTLQKTYFTRYVPIHFRQILCQLRPIGSGFWTETLSSSPAFVPDPSITSYRT